MPGNKNKPIALFNALPSRVAEASYTAACGGDTRHLFQEMCGLDPGQLIDIDIEMIDHLPDPGELAGVIISGSASMVTEKHAWSERAADWVRQHHGKVPVLGVCFGHQLLAHALGGTVAWTASGPEYTTVDVALTPAARDDSLFAGLPAVFKAQSAHHQTVVHLPDSAIELASGYSGIQSARFGAQCWGVQFHPEMTEAANRALLQIFAAGLQVAGVDVAGELSRLQPSPDATRVLTNFTKLALA